MSERKWATDNFRGKGTWKRPCLVDDETYTDNWERTFGKKEKNLKKDKENA